MASIHQQPTAEQLNTKFDCATVGSHVTQQLISTKHFELTRSLDGHVTQALVRFLLLHDLGAGFIEKRQYFSSSDSRIHCMQPMQNIRVLFVY